MTLDPDGGDSIASASEPVDLAKTSSSPSVIVAEVQPNATTSSGMLGRIRSTLGAIRGPMAGNVSGVMSLSLKTRDL